MRSHPVETVSQMIAIVQDMGAGGYAAFALTMIFLQIFLSPTPLC